MKTDSMFVETLKIFENAKFVKKQKETAMTEFIKMSKGSYGIRPNKLPVNATITNTIRKYRVNLYIVIELRNLSMGLKIFESIAKYNLSYKKIIYISFSLQVIIFQL